MPRTVYRVSKGICATSAHSSIARQRSRMARRTGQFLWMGAIERRCIHHCDSGPRYSHLGVLNKNSGVGPFFHPPHAIDIDFLHQPAGSKPIVESRKFPFEQELVLIARGPVVVLDEPALYA